jgi:hypothetical protein
MLLLGVSAGVWSNPRAPGRPGESESGPAGTPKLRYFGCSLKLAC